MPVRVILYVEDNDADFRLVTMVLEKEAPTVRLFRVRDGDEALALLRRTDPYREAPKPDLILLDLNLPKKDGIHVLGELKAHQALRDIPVVMFSASSAANSRADAMRMGAQAYVVKPAGLDLFVVAVRTACSLLERSASE
jgi:CheY-like chemotaxis protein